MVARVRIRRFLLPAGSDIVKVEQVTVFLVLRVVDAFCADGAAGKEERVDLGDVYQAAPSPIGGETR